MEKKSGISNRIRQGGVPKWDEAYEVLGKMSAYEALDLLIEWYGVNFLGGEFYNYLTAEGFISEEE